MAENNMTWGYLKDWAAQNNVTDDAIILTDDGDAAVDISFDPRVAPAPGDPGDEGEEPSLVLEFEGADD